jgi:hypothetical protein
MKPLLNLLSTIKTKNKVFFLNRKGVLISLGTLISVVGTINIAFAIMAFSDSSSGEPFERASIDNHIILGLPLPVSTGQIEAVPDNINITSVYPTGTQVGSISVTIPAAGNVVILTSGNSCVNNRESGSVDKMWVKISEISGAVEGAGSVLISDIDTATPTDTKACSTFSFGLIFPEPSPGTYTFFLNVAVDSTSNPRGEINQTNLVAQYISNPSR